MFLLQVGSFSINASTFPKLWQDYEWASKLNALDDGEEATKAEVEEVAEEVAPAEEEFFFL